MISSRLLDETTGALRSAFCGGAQSRAADFVAQHIARRERERRAVALVLRVADRLLTERREAARSSPLIVGGLSSRRTGPLSA